MSVSSGVAIVPLGFNCAPAHFLRSKGLRDFALPFDWNVCPLESVVSLIEHSFDGFLEKNNLVFLPPVKRMLFAESSQNLVISHEEITPVVCKRYKMLFPHDFSKVGKIELETVKEKYSRRIDRLHELLQSQKKLSFVYSSGELNEWQLEQYLFAGVEFPVLNNQQAEGLLDRISAISPGANVFRLEEAKKLIV